MDLLTLVKELKKRAKKHYLDGLNTEVGIEISWPVYHDENRPITTRVFVGKRAFFGKDKKAPLPLSFQNGIPRSGTVDLSMDELADELAKREIRKFLVGIGCPANEITRCWYV